MRVHKSTKGSKTMTWTGRVLTVLTGLFMLLDGIMKIVKPPQVLEANVRLAYPLSTLSGIGIALIVCTVIYLIPRTSILGAALLTGYLGGAVASNVRAGSGWFETIFPMLFASLVWAGLWLRDRRLRSLLFDQETALDASHSMPQSREGEPDQLFNGSSERRKVAEGSPGDVLVAGARDGHR